MDILDWAVLGAFVGIFSTISSFIALYLTLSHSNAPNRAISRLISPYLAMIAQNPKVIADLLSPVFSDIISNLGGGQSGGIKKSGNVNIMGLKIPAEIINAFLPMLVKKFGGQLGEAAAEGAANVFG